MNSFSSKVTIGLAAILLLGTALLPAQTGTAVLRGQVVDQTGALIPGATISIASGDFKREATASNVGQFNIRGVPAGKYTVRATLKGFAPFEDAEVILTAGQDKVLEIPMLVSMEKQEIEVSETNQSKLDVDASSNAGALVLKGKDLDMLSDDPDDLASDLQALAGPAAGPNGGQIFIDGFTGGRLPPKESIREIRINQNPFAAEFDRLGFGRIEILTRPGSDRYRGQLSANFWDKALNTRNPYLTTATPGYHTRMFSGNFGGPIKKKASFFLDVDRRNVEQAAVINALILDDNFNVVPFSEAVLTPNVRTSINPRFDYAFNTNNTLVARYSFSTSRSENGGVGGFRLPSQGTNSDNNEHSIQLTYTSVVNARAVNETRFRYSRDRSDRTGVSSSPTISIPDAFTGGGASISRTYDHEDGYELHNFTSLTRGRHFVKFGGRLRGVSIDDFTTSGFNGTYSFRTLGDCPSGVVLSLCSSYKVTLQGLRQGLTPAQIRAQGGGANQFTVSGGSNLTDVSRFDLGLFLQDDWRVRPNFSISAGLRFETQNNINDHASWAPRLSFAWGIGSSGAARQPKMVIRGGFGMFYDRFDESLTLSAKRQNGVNQQQFVVPNPDFFPTVPSLATLTANRQTQAIRVVDSALQAPYMAQTAFSLERQLPKNMTMSMTYTNSIGVHTLRSRNINAPLPGTYDPAVPNSGTRPYPGVGNLYLYESSGRFRQNQVTVNINSRISTKLTLFGFYSFSKARSNTDGAGSFPANQYDLSQEYSRAGFDITHRVFIGGGITAPWGIRLSPFVQVNSGGPFNITVGQDLNGDSLFNDRPGIATDLARSSVVSTPLGAFDRSPLPGQTILSRNYAHGPGQFTVNMRLARSWSFGERAGRGTVDMGAGGGDRGGPGGMRGPGGPGGGPGGGGPRGAGGPGGGGPGGGGGGPRGGGGGGPMGGMFDTGGGNGRYSLTLSISARNLLNHVNPGTPSGVLSSPNFLRSTQLAGGFGPGGQTSNRQVELSLRFGF